MTPELELSLFGTVPYVGRRCVVCRLPLKREDGETAVIIDRSPLTLAHGRCYSHAEASPGEARSS